MSQPLLRIFSLNGQTLVFSHDYTQYVAELAPSRNDLDADGSGRDVKTGIMKRTPIAMKYKVDVQMLPLEETLHTQLCRDLMYRNPDSHTNLDKPDAFITVTVLDPATNTQSSKTVYISNVNYGSQLFRPSENKTYYYGMSFSLTER